MKLLHLIKHKEIIDLNCRGMKTEANLLLYLYLLLFGE